MILKSKLLKGLSGLLFLVILFFLIDAAWVGTTNYYRNKEPVSAPGAKFNLSENELKTTIKLAENGDVYATEKLMDYYGIYMDSLEDYKYWKQKIINLAKDGNSEARRFYPGWQELESEEN